jgi:hypothetical protein
MTNFKTWLARWNMRINIRNYLKLGAGVFVKVDKLREVWRFEKEIVRGRTVVAAPYDTIADLFNDALA